MLRENTENERSISDYKQTAKMSHEFSASPPERGLGCGPISSGGQEFPSYE
jgi:hypothetical protein